MLGANTKTITSRCMTSELPDMPVKRSGAITVRRSRDASTAAAPTTAPATAPASPAGNKSYVQVTQGFVCSTGGAGACSLCIPIVSTPCHARAPARQHQLLTYPASAGAVLNRVALNNHPTSSQSQSRLGSHTQRVIHGTNSSSSSSSKTAVPHPHDSSSNESHQPSKAAVKDQASVPQDKPSPPPGAAPQPCQGLLQSQYVVVCMRYSSL